MTGARAATPARKSSGAYDWAICPAKSAACPPWEWPATSTVFDAERPASARAARAASSTSWASLVPTR